MDDKSLNLWRQIEDSRRRGRPQQGNRSKPAPPPDRQTLPPWQSLADTISLFPLIYREAPVIGERSCVANCCA